MGTELEAARPRSVVMADEEINRSWRIAEALAQSGVFPDAKNPAQAFAKMLLGMDLGLSPTQAMTGMHIVEGKPQLAAVTLAGFVRKMPGYDYDVIAHDENECVIVFTRTLNDGTLIARESKFTMEDAKKAELVKDKSAWKKHPRNMLFARAMSNGVKWYCPEVVFGVPVYTEADEFTVRGSLTAGSGGEAQGLDLGPKVEKVLARAEELGHAGLADRAAAEMALGSRSPEIAKEWVQKAEEELDALERLQQHPEEEATDAEVVEDPMPHEGKS